MGQWSYHTEGNTSIEKRGFSASSPDGKLSKPSRQPVALPVNVKSGCKREKSRWSWDLYWQKLVPLLGRYQMSHFPEHGTIQAVGGDAVTSFFSHNFLQKSLFLLIMGFYYHYFSCSLAVLLPLFNFCEVSLSHAKRTIILYKEKNEAKHLEGPRSIPLQHQNHRARTNTWLLGFL